MTKKGLIVILGVIIVIAIGSSIYFLIYRSTAPTQITEKEYACPDLNELDYDKATDTYIEGLNYMPHEGINTTKYDDDSKFEQWVNKKCGIKFKIKIVW
jgi:hypothetical protein